MEIASKRNNTNTIDLEDNDPEKLKKYIQCIEVQYPELTLYKILKEGESFGEISLITGSKRTATIICLTRCEFLVVNKKTFDILLKIFQQ